jgi:hypothetical protein
VEDQVEDQQVFRAPNRNPEAVGDWQFGHAIDQMAEIAEDGGDALVEIKPQRCGRERSAGR